MSAKTIEAPTLAALEEYFASLPDSRIERCRRHKLIDIITIAICTFLCGGEGFTDMEEFGHSRREWLAIFLELPHGNPSHGTFGKVFARLAPAAFATCFERWVRASLKHLAGEVVAVDGKRLRHSYDKAAGKEPIELVSAWARDQPGRRKGKIRRSHLRRGPPDTEIRDIKKEAFKRTGWQRFRYAMVRPRWGGGAPPLSAHKV